MEQNTSTTTELRDFATLRKNTKRARAACELCRFKKVRCDAREGRPCPNCIYENVRCVQPPRRPRKIRRRSNCLRLAGNPWMTQTEVAPQYQSEQSPLHDEMVISAQSPVISNPAPAIPDTSFTLKDPRDWTGDDSDQSSPLSQVPPSLPDQRASNPPTSSPRDLPSFIRPLPATMGPEDIEYLRVKGAFTIPEPELRDACLRCYLHQIHEMYPIVDYFKVLSIIQGTDPSGEKLSLLLFQALIFAGCTWVDVRMVRKAGFLSRKAFRKSVYRKLRLLYDADYESDRICLIQTFVLCTFWWEGPNENKDAWYWIGLALSLCRTIDLHRSSPGSVQNVAESRLRKRLWWTLVARDIVSSFGLSRSPRLRDNDYDVPMLEMEDFDFRESSDSLGGAAPGTVSQQRRTAQLCIAFIKLVCIFGRIFKAAYPENGAGKTAVLYSNQQIEGTNKLPCRRSHCNVDQLKMYEKELDEWRQQVPEDFWHSGPLPSDPDELQKPLLAHQGFLSAFYYAALMTLHRPQMQPLNSNTTPNDTSRGNLEDSSLSEVRVAARRITEIGMDFFVANLVDSFSATWLSCLVPASIVHIFDMSSPDHNVRSEACQQLERCKALFQGFSEQHFAAAWCLSIINYIVSRISRAELQRPESGNGVIISTYSVTDSRAGVLEGGDELRSAHSLHSSPAPSRGDATAPKIVDKGAEANRLISDESTAPSFSTIFEPFTGANASLPVLSMEQPLSNNFANFLGPESMWLDFLSVPEQPDSFNWADGNLLLGNLLP